VAILEGALKHNQERLKNLEAFLPFDFVNAERQRRSEANSFLTREISDKRASVEALARRTGIAD